MSCNSLSSWRKMKEYSELIVDFQSKACDYHISTIPDEVIN